MNISINSIFFIIYSLVIVLSALLSILSKKLIYTLLWAMVVFLAVGGIFLLLGATYNAMVQFLIYVIAIPALIAISIMLTKQTSTEKVVRFNLSWIILGVVVLGIICVEFVSLNNYLYEPVKKCIVYVNSYSDLMSITINLLEKYSILLLEYVLSLLLVVVGLSYYEK